MRQMVAFQVEGMDRGACERRLQTVWATWKASEGRGRSRHWAGAGPSTVEGRARIRARIAGLHCSLCTGTIEKALGRMYGVGQGGGEPDARARAGRLRPGRHPA